MNKILIKIYFIYLRNRDFNLKQMKFKLISFLIILLFRNCHLEKKINNYADHIGEIDFKKNIDDTNFILCDSTKVKQYYTGGYGFLYDGEKFELNKIFFEKYKNVNIKNQSGLIRIQFIVNCNGETDQFRLISIDENYKEKKFDKKITSQLLMITKELKGWIPKNIDYYQYLIFKIENGKLIEILP